jgi:hypothetical protein
MADHVDLVEPPDVACIYRGECWGVACKVAYGSAGTAFTAVKRGIAQLDRSSCSRGVVMLRITDVFPHEEMVPGRAPGMRTVQSFRPGDPLFEVAMALARPFVTEVVRRADAASLFQRSPKLAAVVFVAHTMANMSSPEGAVSIIVPIPNFYVASQRSQPFIDDFITAFRL